MAVWQVKLNISSGQTLLGGWMSWWGYERLCQRIDAVLPRCDSWHEDLKCWGASGKHQIDLWTNKDEFKDEFGEFSIRIDLREDYSDFVANVAALLYDFGLKIERDSILL